MTNKNENPENNTAGKTNTKAKKDKGWTCPHCKRELTELSLFCPSCGTPNK